MQSKLNAGEENPLVNPAIIIKQWGRTPAEIFIDDKPVPKEQIRMGQASTLDGVNLVIWLELESTSPVQLSIKPND